MKTETIEIRVSSAEKAEIRKAAEAMGLSVSAWVRLRLLHPAEDRK